MAALDLLRRLQQRNDAVALLLVDHRMPEMNGVETLLEAMKLYPQRQAGAADRVCGHRRCH